MEFSPEYIALGFLVGLISSLLGLGGSVLIIPILPSLAAITFRETIATSLFAVTLVTMSNVIIYNFKKLINWRLVLTLFPFISTGSYLSAKNSHLVNESFVKGILVIVMLIMLFKLLSKKNTPLKFKFFDSRYFLASIGFLTGVLSGLVGIGGGLILTPIFIIKKIMEPKNISPTINSLIFLGCITGVLGYIDFSLENYPIMGSVHINIGFTIFVFAFLGSLLGIKLNSLISEELRKKIFSLILIVLVVKLILV